MIQILKGLLLGFVEIGRNLWRSSGPKLQVSFAVLLTLLVASFFMKRYRDSFTDRPPQWLKQREFSSPSLPKPIAVEFGKSIELAHRYADQRGVPLGSVRLMEIQPEITNVVLWTTDVFVNPGFNPLSHFERSFRMEPSLFIGYYTSEGKPLDITLKHTPTRPKDLLMTIHLPRPVSPGTSQTVFRLERQLDRVKPSKDGKYQLGLGRMPFANAGIHLWEVRLPESARLARYNPQVGASVSADHAERVTWVNALLDTSAPPLSLVFTLTK